MSLCALLRVAVCLAIITPFARAAVSLTVSKTQFAFNEPITLSFQRTSTSLLASEITAVSDWLAIVNTGQTPTAGGQANTQLWQYVCGGQTVCSTMLGSPSVTFSAAAGVAQSAQQAWPLRVGSYAAYFLSGLPDTTSLVVGPIAFSVVASVSSDRPSYRQGASSESLMSVTFARAVASATTTDRLAIYVGTPSSTNAPLLWQYTYGGQTPCTAPCAAVSSGVASITFDLSSLASGSYNLYYLQEDGTIIAGPQAFSVSGSVLRLAKSSFAHNEDIVATFATNTPATNHRIAIFLQTDTLLTVAAQMWQFPCGGQTACATPPAGSQSVTFGASAPTETGVQPWPLKPNSYKLHLLDGSTGANLAGPVLFTVDTTIRTDKQVYNHADPIVVSFAQATAAALDWVAIYYAFDTLPQYMSGSQMWQYTSGGQPKSPTAVPIGSVTFTAGKVQYQMQATWPLLVGEYKVVLLSNNGYTIKAGPAFFQVVAPPHAVPPPTPGSVRGPRVMSFFSCYDIADDTSAVWNDLLAQQPELIVWSGDAIYGDSTDMTVIRKKYDAKKSNANYKSLLDRARAIPVMATWDDHDMGANNIGKSYTRLQLSQREFARHFDFAPTDARRTGAQSGLYSAQLFGSAANQDRVQVILTDGRTARSAIWATQGPCEGTSSTMLGDAQWAWLTDQVLNVQAEVKVIVSGIQVLPPTRTYPSTNYPNTQVSQYCAWGSDGALFMQANRDMNETDRGTTQSNEYQIWAEVPFERRRLLRLAQQCLANPSCAKVIVFASGDQHWGELLRKVIPADTANGLPAATVFELTASGVNQNWASKNEPNANRYPVWADTNGNGVFSARCVLPFKVGTTTYNGCATGTTTAAQGGPTSGTGAWCATAVDSTAKLVPGRWGRCAAEKQTTPDGRAGVSQAGTAYGSFTPYYINNAVANYGVIRFDPVKREVWLEVRTPYNTNQTAAYTVITYTAFASPSTITGQSALPVGVAAGIAALGALLALVGMMAVARRIRQRHQQRAAQVSADAGSTASSTSSSAVQQPSEPEGQADGSSTLEMTTSAANSLSLGAIAAVYAGEEGQGDTRA